MVLALRRSGHRHIEALKKNRKKEVMLKKTNWYPAMIRAGKVFPTTTDALIAMGFPVR